MLVLLDQKFRGIGGCSVSDFRHGLVQNVEYSPIAFNNLLAYTVSETILDFFTLTPNTPMIAQNREQIHDDE
jgi:hypothetical protein